MKLSTKEEQVVELYRKFDREQRKELLDLMLRVVLANDITKRANGGREVQTVGNVRVRSIFGDTPPAIEKSLRDAPQPRRPDRAQDDNE